MDLKKAVYQILEQLQFVTSNLSNTEFSQPLLSLNNSTIGQHTRHTLEFFTCLYQGLETGVVNYDKREHNYLIETNTEEAENCLILIRENTMNAETNAELTLKGSYSMEEGDEFSIPSNFFRELAYNIEHAVHHMAIIKIGFAEIKPALELPAHFGVAVSTVRYQGTAEKKK